MKVEMGSLKVFLTSGVTLTVKADERIEDMDNNVMDLYTLCGLIKTCLDKKENIEFVAEINHQYKDEKGKEKNQKVKHYYCIPYEKLSWFMIEEV